MNKVLHHYNRALIRYENQIALLKHQLDNEKSEMIRDELSDRINAILGKIERKTSRTYDKIQHGGTKSEYDLFKKINDGADSISKAMYDSVNSNNISKRTGKAVDKVVGKVVGTISKKRSCAIL